MILEFRDLLYTVQRTRLGVLSHLLMIRCAGSALSDPSSFPSIPNLRHCNAFVTNFTAEEFQGELVEIIESKAQEIVTAAWYTLTLARISTNLELEP
ncbi:hypothetical protein EVAR_14128_1 [Eumeta japonica]|uniref:Uncharacterized protein n=1 Tax=Eumeta variegata TaxID=151549 RepID=A0A4C1UEC4_EUMVA|nr:hypothetical protein EVAR_14128_1 [Eumeta japonica]